MTDAQLAALLATISTLATAVVGMLRWAALRITKALDDNTASHKEDAAAKVQLAGEMARLSTKIDGVSRWVEEHTPVEVPIPSPPRRPATQPGATTYLHVARKDTKP